jgi:CRP-like cAMP-binding protein
VEATRNGTNGSENRLESFLPASDRGRLLPKLALVFLNVKTVLFEPGQPVAAVYFPLDGVISLVTPLENGAIVEVATVGNEGLVGVPAVLGGSLAVRAIFQVAGRCLSMETGAFLDELEQRGPLAMGSCQELCKFLQAV